jgi:hypothetical protein
VQQGIATKSGKTWETAKQTSKRGKAETQKRKDTKTQSTQKRKNTKRYLQKGFTLWVYKIKCSPILQPTRGGVLPFPGDRAPKVALGGFVCPLGTGPGENPKKRF